MDSGAVLSVTNVTGVPAWATLTGTSLDVDPGHPDLQSLDAGDLLEVTVTYDVVDEHGASVPQTLTLSITGVNDAPGVSAAVTTTTNEDEGAASADLLANASDVDADAVLSVQNVTQTAGRAVPYTVTGATLEIDPSGFQDLALGESDTVTFSYDVSDGIVSVPATAVFTIEGRNDAPELNGSVDLQLATSGTPYALTLDPGLFTDVDASDVLTLSATQADGDPLPGWLSFTPGTGEFAGTPPSGAGLIQVTVTATDPHGATAETSFWLAYASNTLTGTPNRDSLNGTNATEILVGLGENDSLTGGRGDDIYIIRDGEGLDVINENGFVGTDRLFLSGLTLADVTLDRLTPGGSDLVIRRNGEILVIVEDVLDSSSADLVEEVIFEDGTVLTVSDLNSIILSQEQTAGDDRSFAFFGAQTIDMGGGDDYVQGRRGGDTYVYTSGDGADVINDAGFDGTDILQFTDYASTDATLRADPRSQANLIIDFGNGDSVTLIGAINGSAADQIEQIVFDGDSVTLTPADVRALLIAQSQTSGDDVVRGYDVGTDTLEGGLCNDYLSGDRSSDLYLFNSGDGNDTVDDNGFSSTDIVRFADFEVADAAFTRETGAPGNIVVSFATGDSVTVVGGFESAATDGIERYEFLGSGSLELLTATDIRALILADLETAGNDEIVASFSTSDTVSGGAGDDFLSLGRGSDTYVFEAGDGRDTIDDNGFTSTDVLDLTDFVIADASFREVVGRASDLVITLPGGDEITIIGQTTTTSSIEQFVFSDGTLTYADILASPAFTGAPGDVFNGTSGAETLSANGGYDHIFGLGGGDTYEFDIGDGRVEIEDNGNVVGTDRVVFTGYSSTDAIYSRPAGQPNDLIITLPGGDEVRLRNGVNGSSSDGIEEIVFNGDSTTLSMADVRLILLSQQLTAGDDTVLGFIDAETIEGGLGDDFLNGSAGGDTYVYNPGDGQDTISENASGGSDTLLIQGYDLTDATITRVPGTGADILIDFGGRDSIEVRGTLTGAFFTEIETITFDGPTTLTSLTSADLRNLLADQDATAGDDIIIGTSASDTLEGGLGDDFLSGQGSGDQYVYTFGDGNDTIWENGGGNGDVVLIDGIPSTDVTFERATDDLDTVIMNFTGGGSIRLEGSLNGSFGFGIETVTFNADSTSFTMPQLRDIIIAQTATSGDEDILGWSNADTLYGGAGDDVLRGFGAGDTYVFEIGDGDDVVDDNGGGNGDEIIFNGRDSTDATFSELVPGSDDLLIEFANGDSVIVIGGTTSSFSDRIEEFAFDDVTLTHGDVLLLL